ncbi:MAG: Hsp20/alpha crystallin family protein [Candidatus Hodarchaeota archaeon]
MSMQRWNPFEEMRRLEDEINRLFGEFSISKNLKPSEARYSPLTDLQETDNAFIIHANLPGIKKDELKIEATPEGVEIRAEAKGEKEQTNGKIHYKERYAQKYARSIRFPVAVKPQEGKTTLENGVLTITFPKAEKAKKVKLIPE